MADNGASGNAGEVPAGVPYYEKLRQHLKELVQKRRQLEKQLSSCEDSIYQKESDYLENTPQGNIITGFDNYTKGTTGAAAQRRKTGLTESNRVFSRSSISYNSNAQDAQTPGSVTSNPVSHAPTPMSSSFKDSGSNHPTPTSATAPKSAGATKKKKAAAAAANNEDSDTDSTNQPKKVRTNFGAVKK